MTPEHTTTGAARLREALEEMLHDVASAIGRLRLAAPTTADDDQRRDMELIVAACKRARETLAAVPEAPEPVYEWRAVFPNSDGSYSVQPLAKAPRPGTRMLVEGHNRGWVERRHAVAWERVEEGTEPMSDWEPTPCEECVPGPACAPCADEQEWARDLAERDALAARVEALQRDLERAVETRENANTVSVRVEAENRALAARVEELEARIARALDKVCVIASPNRATHEQPGDCMVLAAEARRILRGEDDTSTERTE